MKIDVPSILLTIILLLCFRRDFNLAGRPWRLIRPVHRRQPDEFYIFSAVVLPWEIETYGNALGALVHVYKEENDIFYAHFGCLLWIRNEEYPNDKFPASREVCETLLLQGGWDEPYIVQRELENEIPPHLVTDIIAERFSRMFVPAWRTNTLSNLQNWCIG